MPLLQLVSDWVVSASSFQGSPWGSSSRQWPSLYLGIQYWTEEVWPAQACQPSPQVYERGVSYLWSRSDELQLVASSEWVLRAVRGNWIPDIKLYILLAVQKVNWTGHFKPKMWNLYKYWFVNMKGETMVIFSLGNCDMIQWVPINMGIQWRYFPCLPPASWAVK